MSGRTLPASLYVLAVSAVLAGWSASPVQAQETIALVGGEVRPVDGPDLPSGTVLLEGGKIVAVGAEVEIPAGAVRIDCSGKVVTPGLIDADSSLGLDTADRTGARVTAAFRTSDAVDSWDARIRTARQQGVTAWFVTGSARDPVGGTTAVFHAGAGPGQAAPLVESAGVAVNLTTTDAGGGLWGAGRLASVRATFVSVRNLSEQLDRWRRDLREYEQKRLALEPTDEERLLMPPEVLARMRDWSPSQRASWREAVYKSMQLPKRYSKPKKLASAPRKPRTDASREILLSLLGAEGEPGRRAVLRAELPREIEGALELAKEFRLDAVVLGGSGLLEHATALKRRRIPVVVTQLADAAQRDTGPLSRRTDGLVARLVEAGLEPALGSGDALGGARFLRLLAAREIGHGLSDVDALRAVTLWAARAAGVDGEIGSLTVGKRADVVIWNGDPFAATSRAELVFVAGRRSGE